MAGGRRAETRLPDLGARGEGWVVLQAVLIVAVLVAAVWGHGWSGTARVVAYACAGALIALGVCLLVAGGSKLGRALTPLPAPKRGGDVAATGVYRLVRHPMYGGGLLFAAGWTTLFASLPGVVCTILLAVFLDLKSRREEHWLVDALPGYEAYRRATPRRLVPFVY